MSSYQEAGVDVTAGYAAVELMKKHVARTKTDGVLNDIGGFGGLFMPDFKTMEAPVLVSGTDGVGTKLKLAFLLDKHDTVGIDCVAMCCNDIICHGAVPLFFLDYIACGRNRPEKIAAIVSGVAEGCVQAGCALIGGETAEHPGMMPDDEYDLAGFAVGAAEKDSIINGQTITPGDIMIALPSGGVHSNGFSLIRKIFSESELCGPLGETLLTPTKIYVKTVLSLMKELSFTKEVNLKGAAHITGGGLIENIPRILPPGLRADIQKSALRPPEIFERIQRTGNISDRDMVGTFNMGVGMALVVSDDQVDRALACLRALGEEAVVIGQISQGERESGEVLKFI